MDRREFLTKAGLGSVGLAYLAGAPVALGDPGGGKRRRFFFVAISKAMTVDGVDHRIAMNGGGIFVAKDREIVEAGGSFTHFDNAAQVSPRPIIAFGRWRGTQFVSFEKRSGVWGAVEASILEMLVTLKPRGGPQVRGVTLRLICNIGPAGLSTGEPEGYRLTIPGAPFGAFEPLVPPAGLTHISARGL